MKALKYALISSTALLLAWSAAFTPELSESDIQEAVTMGTQMVSQRSGYHLEDWVLFGVTDPLSILPEQGEIEAVIVATPFELVRYQSFLVTFQNKAFTTDQANTLAAQLKDTIAFQVFVHAPGVGDQYRDFLSDFTKASFTALNGEDLTPVKIDTFGPAQDFYNIPGSAVQIRYLGYVLYHFDLSSLNESAANLANLTGTFSLTDSAGQAHSYDVDLSKYR